MSRFASGKKSLAICDICGFQYKLRELRDLIVKGRNSNLMACPECWNPDQPQLSLGSFPVDDPQAIRNPRPDYNQYAQSRAQIIPVRGVVGTGFIGTVTVTT
jgi:hypothetical protein